MVLARVRRTIRERALLDGGERVLVACSGGPDSAALLHVLHRLAPELRLTLFAASVDHGLRADAARDVEVAGALAARLDVPFAALRVSVPREGASLMAKLSVAGLPPWSGTECMSKCSGTLPCHEKIIGWPLVSLYFISMLS